PISGAVAAVALLADGRRALLAGEDPLLRLWDTTRAEELRVFEPHHTQTVRALAVPADDRSVVSATDDGTVRVLVVESGGLRHTCRGHRSCVTSVALSRDGRRAVSGSFDHTVRLWDVTTGKLLQTFPGHADYVRGVALSPDGTLAASASKDGTVRL